MHQLRMLGEIGLSTTDGGETDNLLRQPKRIALLAFLAMPQPGTWHRRDTLLGTFWPEHDDAHARTALRSALYTLRRNLPDGAVRTRGDDDVSLAPELIQTDAALMADDVSNGRFAEALARYKGDLLPGLHIDEAEEFEKWLSRERSHLNALARKAALQLADIREKSGDLAGAIEAVQRASEIDPDAEATAQRLIALLDRSGDRARAFAVYEQFRRHISEQFGTTPSAETIALVDSVRTRRAANPQAITKPVVISSAGSPVAAAVVPPAPTPSISTKPRSSPKWAWGIGAVVLLIAVGAWTAISSRRAPVNAEAKSLVVLPAENETGDPKLDYVASGVAEGVARRLDGLGGWRIRSGARSEWPSATRHDYKAIGRELGSTILLRTTVARSGDSLEARASVVDARTAGERTIGARAFSTSSLRDVESHVAADVAGTVFRVPLPTVPRQPAQNVNPESYRLTLEGWELFRYQGLRSGGKQLFQRATDIDPQNARAWAGLSSAYAVETIAGTVPFDVGYDRASAAAARAIALDSLQSSAWGNLAILRALKYRSLAVGLELMQRAIAAEPGNAEIFLIKSTLYRHAHRWDDALDAVRVARALDPLSASFAEREGFAELCADRPQLALRMFKTESQLDPNSRVFKAGIVRSLARLGRYDEAIAEWKKFVDAKNVQLVQALAQAHGVEGYWRAKHVEGAAALSDIRKLEAAGTWVANMRSLRAHFEGGDSTGGFRVLEAAIRAKDPRMYHLVCSPGVDEVRDTPHFKALLAEVGALPDR